MVGVSYIKNRGFNTVEYHNKLQFVRWRAIPRHYLTYTGVSSR